MIIQNLADYHRVHIKTWFAPARKGDLSKRAYRRQTETGSRPVFFLPGIGYGGCKFWPVVIKYSSIRVFRPERAGKACVDGNIQLYFQRCPDIILQIHGLRAGG